MKLWQAGFAVGVLGVLTAGVLYAGVEMRERELAWDMHEWVGEDINGAMAYFGPPDEYVNTGFGKDLALYIWIDKEKACSWRLWVDEGSGFYKATLKDTVPTRFEPIIGADWFGDCAEGHGLHQVKGADRLRAVPPGAPS